MKILIILVIVLIGAAGTVWLLNNRNVHITPPMRSTMTPTPTIDFDQEAHEMKDLIISAWLPWWDTTHTTQSFETAKTKLHSIYPVWYHLDENGSVVADMPSNLSAITNSATTSAIIIMPTINNENDNGFDSKRVEALINNPQKTRQEIAKLIIIAQTNGYQGWDIDWEDVKPASRDQFTDFIKLLATELHKNNLQLAIAVHPQTGVDDYEGSKSQNWDELSKYADYLQIMAYDFHWSGSAPGAVTPLTDLYAVLDYATKHIPLEKIELGIPAYGYDWTNGKNGENVEYTDLIKRIQEFHGQYNRDPDSTALHGTYTDTKGAHEVWFEDKNSMIHKIRIGRSYGIDRYSVWRLGGEDASIWESIF